VGAVNSELKTNRPKQTFYENNFKTTENENKEHL
jgi:hypothetical protein